MKTNRKKIFGILVSVVLMLVLSATAVFAAGDGGSSDFKTPTDGNGGWVRVTPCYKLNWVNDESQLSVVVAKKGHDYVVWSYEALEESEQQAIYESFKANVNGMNGAKYSNVKFISGNGASYAGVTVNKDTISFDRHCTWSMYAMGLCTKTYYTSYDVRYVDRTTDADIAAPKTVDNVKVGETVSEEAIESDNYDLDDDSVKTLTLQKENNEIIFYYKPAVANYTVRYVYTSEDGEYVDIIAPENGTGNVGSTISKSRKSFAEYELISPERVIRKTLTRNDDDNVIIFEYRKVY